MLWTTSPASFAYSLKRANRSRYALTRQEASVTMIAALTPTEWLAGMEKQIAAVAALMQLVDSPTPGKPDPVKYGRAYVHLDFRTFQSGMAPGGDGGLVAPEGQR